MKLNSFLPLVLLVFIAGGCEKNTSKIIFHKSHESKRHASPFSDAVESNGFLFLSGQMGIDHNTRTLVEGGIAAETQQCIENIKAVLEQHDLSLNHVVKCTVVLSSMDDFSTFNEIYKNYFPNKPARTTFAASGLALNGHIEIEVIASR